jgi:hypothetical protein
MRNENDDADLAYLRELSDNYRKMCPGGVKSPRDEKKYFSMKIKKKEFSVSI